MITTRRGFLTGLATFIAAPAIIRVAPLMPVKAYDEGVLLRATLRTTTLNPKALWPGIQQWWELEFDRHAGEWSEVLG